MAKRIRKKRRFNSKSAPNTTVDTSQKSVRMRASSRAGRPPAAPPECPTGYEFNSTNGLCCNCVEPKCPPGTVYDQAAKYCVEIGYTGPDHPQISYPTKPDHPSGGFGIEGPHLSQYSVLIGSQWWMAENLKTTHYNNGDPILEVELTDPAPGGSEWTDLADTETGAYAIYDNDPMNAEIYGNLYNWYAVNDSRGICPEGWHVPSHWEWNTLIYELGYMNVAGGKMKETGFAHWNSPNTGATNESGFTALPGGSIGSSTGSSQGMGIDTIWWSSPENTFRKLRHDASEIMVGSASPINGGSVRCVGD